MCLLVFSHDCSAVRLLNICLENFDRPHTYSEEKRTVFELTIVCFFLRGQSYALVVSCFVTRYPEQHVTWLCYKNWNLICVYTNSAEKASCIVDLIFFNNVGFWIQMHRHIELKRFFNIPLKFETLFCSLNRGVESIIYFSKISLT